MQMVTAILTLRSLFVDCQSLSKDRQKRRFDVSRKCSLLDTWWSNPFTAGESLTWMMCKFVTIWGVTSRVVNSTSCPGLMKSVVISDAFEGYDLDGTGVISRDNLRKMFKAYFYITIELVRDVVKACEEEMVSQCLGPLVVWRINTLFWFGMVPNNHTSVTTKHRIGEY